MDVSAWPGAGGAWPAGAGGAWPGGAGRSGPAGAGGCSLIITVLSAYQAAQQAGGGQEMEDQEMPEAGQSRRGRKRASWEAIKPQSKKLCTASIEAQVVRLAEERGTEPETILANIMHR